jgi:hypothetical protein
MSFTPHVDMEVGCNLCGQSFAAHGSNVDNPCPPVKLPIQLTIEYTVTADVDQLLQQGDEEAHAALLAELKAKLGVEVIKVDDMGMYNVVLD